MRILTAWPGPTTVAVGEPAGAVATTSSVVGGDATSALRSAKPSIAELSKGGDGIEATRSAASTAPCATDSARSSASAGPTTDSTSRRASTKVTARAEGDVMGTWSRGSSRPTISPQTAPCPAS